VSIYELAKLVKTMTGSQSDIQPIPYEEAYQPGFEDMDRRVPNIAKLSQLVGYKPKYRLKEIVNQVIASRRAELEALSSVPVTTDLLPHSLRAGAGD
jgi:UDP-glucose 4-epimerase